MAKSLQLIRCPGCRTHVRADSGVPCPFCGASADAVGPHTVPPPTGLVRLGLRVAAVGVTTASMACGSVFFPTPEAVYGAPGVPIPMPNDDASNDADEGLIQDGWSYEEVQSGAGGPDEETTPTEDP